MTIPASQAPWWTQGVFLLLGVIVGFFAGRVRDWLEGRRTKKLFLKAVRVELSRIREHLDGTLKDATATKERLEQGTPEALHTVTVFQTGIYASQLSKLRDVFDPLVMEVIRFYDKLSNLERVKSKLASVSTDLATWTGATQHGRIGGPLATHYATTLDEVIKRINQILPDADNLIIKLPQ
jgi:hypothetical protein